MWSLVKFGALLISAIFFIFSFFLNDINMLFISLILLFLYSILFAIEKYQERIVYILFLITFFVYLLGNYLFLFFSESQWWQPFSQEITRNTIYCLMLSLVSIKVGYSITTFLNSINRKNNKKAIDKNIIFNGSLRKLSKQIFWITCLPSFYLILDKITYSRIYGYVEIYKSYTGGSFFLDKLDLLNSISFFMFLATMPRKNESKWVVTVFLLYGGLTLLAGARTTAVTSILIVIFYYIFRNNYDSKQINGEVWFLKKNMLSIILLSPIVIVFLSFWGYYRVNTTLDNLTVSELFFGFFKTQGTSVNIISYVQELEFPSTNISYTFGPIIYFLKYNLITSLFIKFPNYAAQTVEAALYGNNMSYTITYLVMPNNYLAGIGMGSSYIAELFCDFGYWGVLIFNIFLGVILFKFSNVNTRKPWVFAVYLLTLQSFLNLPRNVALIWFRDAINITTIGTIIALYILAKLISERKKMVISNEKNIRDFR